MEDLEKLKSKLSLLGSATGEVSRIIDTLDKTYKSVSNAVKIAEDNLARIKDQSLAQSKKIREERDSFEAYRNKELESISKTRRQAESLIEEYEKRLKNAADANVVIEQKERSLNEERKKLVAARIEYETKLANLRESVSRAV